MHASKCDNVLSNLLCINPGVVLLLLQETKLDDPHILSSPVILTNILSPLPRGASGGIISAWSSNVFRLNTRENLLRKKHNNRLQMCARIFLWSATSRSVSYGGVWDFSLTASKPGSSSASNDSIPPLIRASVLGAIFWRIWEHRNNYSFRSEDPPVRVLLSRIISDLNIWRHRFPERERVLLELWCRHVTTNLLYSGQHSA